MVDWAIMVFVPLNGIVSVFKGLATRLKIRLGLSVVGVERHLE